MKNPWIFPAATMVVGTLGGFFFGKNSGEPDSSAKLEEAAVKTRSSNRSEGATGDLSPSKRANRAGSMAEISRIPGNSNRLQALMDFYARLTPSELEEEARKLESLPMNERIMASILLFGRWAEEDPTAAMTFSNTMGFTGMFVRPTILQSWASVDPANAAKYYSENPREFAMMGMMGGGRGPMRGQAGATIIASEWARQDPGAALAWASTLSGEKGPAMNGVITEVAKTDPKKATEMLSALTGDDKTEACQSVAAQYGSSNFAEAKAWILTLPQNEQNQALAAAIGGLSNNDPDAAAKQVAEMEDGRVRNELVAEVVGDLVRVNPQSAADFLKQQGNEDAQREGMRQLMPSWVGQNAGAALTFANSYPAGDVRDTALQSYVWSNSSAAPADLVKVAESITNPGDRNRSIGLAAARWMREDEPAAKVYIEQSSQLNDNEKQRILEGRGLWGGGRGGRGR